MRADGTASQNGAGAGGAGSLEAELARISGEEMVAGFDLGRGPPWTRRLAQVGFEMLSMPVAKVFALCDRRAGEVGIERAARDGLSSMGARWTADPPPQGEGPLLIVANHPGSCDALALIATLGRRDLALFGADRGFLRAMPGLAPNLILLPAGGAAPGGMAGAMRLAARHLAAGGALVTFPAGCIEPDPAFLDPGQEPLRPWQAGTGLLVCAAAAARGRVAIAITGGVSSGWIRRSFAARFAERRGVATLPMLVQAAVARVAGFELEVRFGPAQDAAAVARGCSYAAVVTARLKEQALALIRGRAWPG